MGRIQTFPEMFFGLLLLPGRQCTKIDDIVEFPAALVFGNNRAISV